NAADGLKGSQGTSTDTLLAAADRSVLNDCGTPGRRWFVWCTGDFGPPAYSRDWITNGPRRGTVAYLSFNCGKGTLPQCDRNCDWSDSSIWTHTHSVQHVG